MNRHLKEDRRRGTSFFPYQMYATSKTMSGCCTPAHWHDEMEVVHILSGEMTIRLGEDSFCAKAGEVVLVNPGWLHRFDSADTPLNYNAFVFPLELLQFEQYDVDRAKVLNSLRSGRLRFAPRPVPNKSITECLHGLASASNMNNQGDTLMVRGLLLYLTGLLVNSGQLQKQGANRSEKQAIIKEILTYIKNHSQEPMRLDEVAGEFGMTPKYFCQYFKKHAGRSFIDYVNYLRIQNAAELLRQSNAKQIEVAMQAGYNNLSYFIRRFKREIGLTPSEYRRQADFAGVVEHF